MKILTADDMRELAISKPWLGFGPIARPLSRSYVPMVDAIMAKPTKRPVGNPYTPAQDAELTRLHGLGCPAHQIGEEIGRGHQSVLSRGRRLGLSFPRSAKRVVL
jgi:hypothetical protein